VEANRPAVVLLKATYDPRWTATVDGLPDEPTMMAPSLVGVEVTRGHHIVRFKYRPYHRYPVLLALGAFTLLGLWIYPRRAAMPIFLGRRIAVRRRLFGRVKLPG
jgi:hypothetical protein